MEAENFETQKNIFYLFYLQETFAQMIRDAGFGFVKHENLTGGIAAIHSGFKL